MTRMTTDELHELIALQSTRAYHVGRDDALALAIDLLITKGHPDAARLLRSLTRRTAGRVTHEPPTAQLTAVPPPRTPPPDPTTHPSPTRTRLHLLRPAPQENP